MAVYQISKIQVRRGKKGVATGVPQLSSGEFAWAIDSQELFIGSGTLSEGAPALENVKILTSKDNIFEFDYYQYKEGLLDGFGNSVIQTGPTDDSPVRQSINNVLDRIAWAGNFDIEPDLLITRTTEIQRAVNELFLKKYFSNTSTNDLQPEYRVELRFTAGVYRITDTIYLPSYVTIIGEGVDKTIFQYEGAGNAFEFVPDEARDFVSDVSGQFTVNSSNIPWEDFTSDILGNTASDKGTKFAKLKDFTIYLVDPQAECGLQLNAVSDSHFENIKIVGNWEFDVENEDVLITHGIRAVGSETIEDLTCKRNIFKNITISGRRTGIFSIHNIYDNVFENCRFESRKTASIPVGSLTEDISRDIRFGIVLGEGSQFDEFFGPRRNIVSNCYFDNIIQHGVHIASGTNNKIVSNHFEKVGESSDGVPLYNIIKIDQDGNSTLNNTYSRYNDFKSADLVNNYVSEIKGIVYHQSLITRKFEVPTGTDTLIRLPLNTSNSYVIDYVYKSANQLRKGKLNVAVGIGSNETQLTDEYESTGNLNNELISINENLHFSAEVVLKPSTTTTNVDSQYPPSNTAYELVISYTNNTSELGNIVLTYNILVQD